MFMPIIFAVILLIALPIYIFIEYGPNKIRTLIAKTFCSLMFVSAAASGYRVFDVDPGYGLWIIAALVFGTIGDMFLVYIKQSKPFVLGLSAFLIGQLIYSATFIRMVGLSIWDIVIFVSFISIILWIYHRIPLDVGKMKLPVLMYLLIITVMFSLALSTLYKGGLLPEVRWMIAGGATLFIASDIVLAFVKFAEKPPRCLRAINLALYYSAQIVLALTVAVTGMLS